MNLSTTSHPIRRLEFFQRFGFSKCRPSMRSSSSTTIGSRNYHPASAQFPVEEGIKLPPLSVMSTGVLLRSYFITTILSSPRLLKVCLPLMKKIANSDSLLLNPDRNPLLHVIVRKLVYDHFAAGETEPEIRRTVTTIKNMGFKGVILGYAKEANVTGGTTKTEVAATSTIDPSKLAIQAWKEGTLKTLGMIGDGDFLAVKFSGAGPSTLNALATKQSPPAKMWEAMQEICEAAAQQCTRIWIDAEQQDLQGSIDTWVIELMRKHNQGEKCMVYTTMQAYLKHTSENILQILKLAQKEGWVLGIKLVRGAYIATERRDLIHNTIEDTHNAYNSIAENLLQKEYPGVPSSWPYPRVALFLATHNDESIKRAYLVQRSLILAGKPTLELGYGQLQGMADEVSYGLLQYCQMVQPNELDSMKLALSPNIFKCLTWGTTHECLQFLLRRVKENQDALGRTQYWVMGFRQELWRRVKFW